MLEDNKNLMWEDQVRDHCSNLIREGAGLDPDYGRWNKLYRFLKTLGR